MWSGSSFRSAARALALAALCCAPAIALAQPFPVLNGDPVDSNTNRAQPILPGVPLILPQNDGKYDPPIVVSGTIDVSSRGYTGNLVYPAEWAASRGSGGSHIGRGGLDDGANPRGNPGGASGSNRRVP